MVRLYASACIEAPAAAVWARLARLEDIRLWSEQVLRARCEGAVTRGVGAERTCDLVGNMTITERWIAWDEGRSFTYEGSGIGVMRRAANRWSVIPQGEQTLLTSEAEVEFAGGEIRGGARAGAGPGAATAGPECAGWGQVPR